MIPLSCVILACGKSRRFGENKLLRPLCGKPLISYTLESIPVDCFSEILIVTHYPAIAELARKLLPQKLKIVSPSCPSLEVDNTIRTAASALSPDSLGALFCVADQPFRTRSSLTRMVQLFADSPDSIIALSYQGKRGNPVLFPCIYFDELCNLREGESGRTILQRYPEKLLLSPAASPQELMDIDSLADWTEAESYCKGQLSEISQKDR